MSKNALDTFCTSLDRLEVEWTRTDVADFRPVLEDILVDPAIGAPLPFEGELLDGVDLSLDPTPGQIDAAKMGVTAARLGIADYGTVTIEGTPDATEAASLFPERHVAILRASDLVPDMPAAFERLGPLLREEATSVVLATGPSATADMGALVRGAHGPKHVHVIILQDR